MARKRLTIAEHLLERCRAGKAAIRKVAQACEVSITTAYFPGRVVWSAGAPASQSFSTA